MIKMIKIVLKMATMIITASKFGLIKAFIKTYVYVYKRTTIY